MRKIALSVLAVVLSIGTLTACNSNGSTPYYDTLCVNPYTQIREPYYYCTNNPSWVYYVPYGYLAPAYGVHISHYTVNHYHRPANATIHTNGVPSSGGKAKRYSTGNTTVKNGTKVNLKKNSGGGNKNGGSGGKTSKKGGSIFGGGGRTSRIGSRTGRH